MAMPDPSAVAPAAGVARALPWTTLAILFVADPFMLLLVFAASRIAVRYACGRLVADVALLDLNVIVLVLIVRWSRLSPPGSASRRYAWYAMWVATTSFTLGMTWVMVGAPALNLEAVIWVLAVFGVLSTLSMLIFL